MNAGTAPMTGAQSLGELLEEGAAALRSSPHGQEDGHSRRESGVLLRAATGLSAADLLLHRNAKVAGADAARFREWIDARARGVPLQHLLGSAAFHAIELRIEPGVFIPRPETETLVEHALSEVLRDTARQDRPCILDLCTGTGAVALAIARALVGKNIAARVYAGDRDHAALDLARRNALQLGLAAQVDIRESDLAEAFADLSGQVDILTANPPYIDPACADSLPFDVGFGDPPQALFDPEGGSGFHRRIADQGRTLLRAGGTILLEIGEDQGARVARILEDCGYADVQILPDLAGRDRIARGRWSPSTPSS
ncbi:MAG TPA: peptide chain release factor N(5)-glutamine methyltransferase [bacterium]|nr:peptide chain release factor N(5)-glutamine methyltransferase [bacterium]